MDDIRGLLFNLQQNGYDFHKPNHFEVIGAIAPFMFYANIKIQEDKYIVIISNKFGTQYDRPYVFNSMPDVIGFFNAYPRLMNPIQELMNFLENRGFPYECVFNHNYSEIMVTLVPSRYFANIFILNGNYTITINNIFNMVSDKKTFSNITSLWNYLIEFSKQTPLDVVMKQFSDSL